MNVPVLLKSSMYLMSLLCLHGCYNASRSVERDMLRDWSTASLKAESDVHALNRLCERTAQQLLQLPHETSLRIINFLPRYYTDLKFDERTYRSREKSLNRYFILAQNMVNDICTRKELSEQIWLFQVAVVDRINYEMEKCRAEPFGGPYGDVSTGSKHFLTQKQYLHDLHFTRFEFIRNSFETGAFTKYYHSLPEESRAKWLKRIEAIAHRKVVIWDPEHQLVELPSYKPEDTESAEKSAHDGSIESLGGGKNIRMYPVKNRSFQ